LIFFEKTSGFAVRLFVFAGGSIPPVYENSGCVLVSKTEIMEEDTQPAHPGAVINQIFMCLREETGHNYTLAEIANGLGITQKMLADVLNEHVRISSEMCVRLSEAFGTSAEFWMDIQANYDLWQAERTVERKSIMRFPLLQSGARQSG
jgi:antitoxin HigA-1